MIDMFTGIVESMGTVSQNDNGRLVISRPVDFDDIAIGSSISISGVCLTVVELNEKSMAFDTVPETLAKTTLGEKKEGDLVNLERALKADGRFEGHIVQGHVETRAVSGERLAVSDGSVFQKFIIPDEILSWIVEKGSIAIDGVSLTVANLEGDICSIALIPHTLENTTLGLLKEGDTVNIETDIFARYVCNIESLKIE